MATDSIITNTIIIRQKSPARPLFRAGDICGI